MLPTVADVLALEPVRRGAPRVLAGDDRLSAPVRWAHVIELAQPGHLLRGGELVLSTGIALPPDADGLARYVAELAAAGVSALAVELGSRYIRELPRGLVEAAVAWRLPLIVLERETQFVAVTEAVHARILAAQVAELRATERLHQVFTDLAMVGASQDEIVARASDFSRTPVILEDLAHRVLACAGAGPDLTSLLAGHAGRSRGVTVPGQSGYDAASGWLVATVAARGPAWGRLIFPRTSAPGPGDTVLAERAATTVALARMVSRGSGSPRRQAGQALLTALAGPGYADPVDLLARLSALLGFPLAGRRMLPVVALQGPAAQPRSPADAGKQADARLADELDSACQVTGAPAITGLLGERDVAALLALPPDADPQAAVTRISSYLARWRANPAGGGQQEADARWIGVGPVLLTLAHARDAFREARDAAHAAASLHPATPPELARPTWPTTPPAQANPVPATRLAELRLAGLLYQLGDDPRVLAFAEHELGPLLAHDHAAGTDLVRVLACYLESGGHKARAARHAGIARPTLYERLRQIEQILAADLEQPRTRLSLHAALIVLRAWPAPQ